MTVVVFNGPERARYDRISAIGIGHQRKDLILVPEGNAEAIQIEPGHWSHLEVDQVDQPPAVERVDDEKPLRAMRFVERDS
jgi:hypothetical protein